MERRGGPRLEGVAGPQRRAVLDLERCGEEPAHERANVFYRRQRPPDPGPAGAVEAATGPGVAYSGKRILKRFVISNRGDRITLVLVVSPVPGVRITVWGSRPCNRGILVGIRCPRLGELPAPQGGVSDITWHYFRKHWAYIEKNGVELVGKRIFIQLRVEVGGWGTLREVASAVVPPPEVRGGRAKRA